MGWVRSKPVYARLSPVASAGRHVLATMGPDAIFVVAGLKPLPGESIHLHAGGEAPDAIVLRSGDFLFARLGSELSSSPASVALYLAGPERFIWQCHRIAREHGMPRDRILTALAGSAARAVYCVHCKTITPEVTTSVVRCDGCGQALLVRDHFSRHLAAYAGVRIDAEFPGEIPEPEVLYA